MLESDVFQRCPGQSAVLQGIVEIALNEKSVTAARLYEVVFPREMEPSNVRVQAKNLALTTAKYYMGPGKDDLVLIYLESWTKDKKERKQAGDNYKPTFAFNLQHRLTRMYFTAWTKMCGGIISRIPEAMADFGQIVQEDPEYADAWLAIGDSCCWMAMLGYPDDPGKAAEAIEKAAQVLGIATELAPDSWHTHATRAFVNSSHGRFDDARKDYAKALRVNRVMTEGYPPFLLFLIGDQQMDAGDFIESKALELIGNPTAQGLHGRLLDWAGKPEEAEKSYREALALDPNNGLCHLGLSRLLEKEGRKDEAAKHAKRAAILMESDYETLLTLEEHFTRKFSDSTEGDRGPDDDHD
jgi:tetratricopeptide (TPR) repeat protein